MESKLQGEPRICEWSWKYNAISQKVDNPAIQFLTFYYIEMLTLFLIYNAFVTLFKHNFTIFSTYSETYMNDLQRHMHSFFCFHSDMTPQVIIKSSKLCFQEKIKDTLFFKHKNIQYICYSELNWLSIILQFESNLHLRV